MAVYILLWCPIWAMVTWRPKAPSWARMAPERRPRDAVEPAPASHGSGSRVARDQLGKCVQQEPLRLMSQIRPGKD